MPADDAATPRGAIIIPVKAFDKAKERLATTLTADERISLARTTATHVVNTAVSLPQFDLVAVVCDDDDTAAWARTCGAEAIIAPRPGLNEAVDHAYGIVRQHHKWIAICHADIANAAGLAALHSPAPGSIVIVADRHGLGTNVLALNSGDDFTFRYGPTSFADHLAEAARRGLSVWQLDDAGLALDLDTPDDVALLSQRDPGKH
jgi:2-phospho-L-lactate guanylyltransferase